MHRNTYIKYLYRQGYVNNSEIVIYVFNLDSPYANIPGQRYLQEAICGNCNELKSKYKCCDDYCSWNNNEGYTDHQIQEYTS